MDFKKTMRTFVSSQWKVGMTSKDQCIQENVKEKGASGSSREGSVRVFKCITYPFTACVWKYGRKDHRLIIISSAG